MVNSNNDIGSNINDFCLNNFWSIYIFNNGLMWYLVKWQWQE